LNNGLPQVPVDDIQIHPRDNDLVLGTHGRGVWILDDITPLEQLKPAVLDSDVHLFDIRPSTVFNLHDNKAYVGDKVFLASNPPAGAIINYYLKEEAEEGVKIIIAQPDGRKVREIAGPGKKGINRIVWDLRYPARTAYAGERFGVLGPPAGPLVVPDEFTVVLEASGTEKKKTVKLSEDPRTGVPLEERRLHLEAVLACNRLFYRTQEVLAICDDLRGRLNRQAALISAARVSDETVDAVAMMSERVDVLHRTIDSTVRQIGELSDVISRYDDRPTPSHAAQIRAFAEKTERFDRELLSILKDELPRLNKLLNEEGLPFISLDRIVEK
jgi:hypothetical protein